MLASETENEELGFLLCSTCKHYSLSTQQLP